MKEVIYDGKVRGIFEREKFQEYARDELRAMIPHSVDHRLVYLIGDVSLFYIFNDSHVAVRIVGDEDKISKIKEKISDKAKLQAKVIYNGVSNRALSRAHLDDYLREKFDAVIIDEEEDSDKSYEGVTIESVTYSFGNNSLSCVYRTTKKGDDLLTNLKMTLFSDKSEDVNEIANKILTS